MITDSNRRRILVPSRLAQNAGPVLAADEEPSVDAALLNPFPAPDAQTVAVYEGIAAVRAPSSPGFPQFPEHRPFAALDGDEATHWQADRALTRDRHVLEVVFDRRRDVGNLQLLPYNDRGARVTAVVVNGTHVSGARGLERAAGRADGRRPAAASGSSPKAWTRPPPASASCRSPACRRPRRCGRRCSPSARWPAPTSPASTSPTCSSARRATIRSGARASTAPPARRSCATAATPSRASSACFSPPAARSWAIDGWASVPNDVSDAELDRLAGVRGRFTSSSRFQGRPGFRASSAFDSIPQPWIGQWPSHGRVWLEWEQDEAATLSTLRLAPFPGVRRPTQVRVIGDLQATPPLTVAADGTVRLPSPLRAKRFRIEILRAAFPPGTPGGDRQRRAVGIAEIRGAGVPRAEVRRAGPIDSGCGAFDVTVGAKSVPVRINATLEDLDAGRPLGFSGCEPLALPAGPARLSVEPGTADAVPAAPALAGLLPARSGAAGCRRLAGNRDPRRADGRAGDARRPRTPDPGRELQPRAPRELRRPRPRRAVGRRRVRYRVERARRPAARWRSPSPRTGWCTRATSCR